MKISAVLLTTGGASRRMRTDKARIVRNGVPQAVFLAGLIAKCGLRGYEVGPGVSGLSSVGDARPFEGAHRALPRAVARLIGSLSIDAQEWILTLPVDLYRLEADGLVWLAGLELTDPTVLSCDGVPQWTLSCAPASAIALATAGRLADLLPEAVIREVPSLYRDQFRDSDTLGELPSW
ncbi:MAG: hypothetical protein ACYDHP_02575 [Ferrimicrobium sp.]